MRNIRSKGGREWSELVPDWSSLFIHARLQPGDNRKQQNETVSTVFFLRDGNLAERPDFGFVIYLLTISFRFNPVGLDCLRRREAKELDWLIGCICIGELPASSGRVGVNRRPDDRRGQIRGRIQATANIGRAGEIQGHAAIRINQSWGNHGRGNNRQCDVAADDGAKRAGYNKRIIARITQLYST